MSLSPSQLLKKSVEAVPAENVAGYWNMRRPRGKANSNLYTIRFIFAEPEALKSASRVFDVELQGVPCLEKLDVAGEAGGPRRGIIKTIDDIALEETLHLKLKSRSELPPIISGLQVTRKASE